ncbi:MAG: class I SAM-dependent methyltransferase [Ignavibacteria bacterium]|jgi:SAM-dependent methyltransferase
MKSISKFTGKVGNYVKYRPGYPEAILHLLDKEIGFDQFKDVADIGSGPGKLSKLFLNNDNLVYGVEPNDEMREAGEKLLEDYINFISIKGTAEFTALADRSIDVIVSGQAFHWFDSEKAKIEFNRILKPGGYVVLIWNKRDMETSEFMKEYEKLVCECCPEYNPDLDLNEKTFNKFYGVKNFHLANFRNSQVFDFNGLKGRLLSASYAPSEITANKEILSRLKDIFDKRNKDGKIKFEYNTKVYFGKIKK